MYDKIDLKSSNEFTLVSSKPNSHPKKLQNPLYNTLILLQKKKHPLLQNIKLQHKNGKDGGVYYISLSKPKAPLSYSDFEFKECHLTVHQHYEKDKDGIRNGLGTIHYTECYERASAQEQLIVHVYFSKQGIFQYIQTKLYSDNQTRDHGVEVTLASPQLMQIRENSVEPGQTVLKLALEHYQLYLDAVKTANQIEADLKLSYSATNRFSIGEYVKNAEKFIAAINLINQLSDAAKDQRGKLMAAQIKSITKTLTDFEHDEEPKDLVIVDEKRPAATNNSEKDRGIPPASRAGKDKKEQTLLQYEAVNALVQDMTAVTAKLKLQPSNVSLLVKQWELANQLNLQLLILSSMSSCLNKTIKQKIKSWASIANQKSNLLDVFLESCWEGQLEAVQELYPIVGHLVNHIHISDLLFKIAGNITPESEQKGRTETFNFLYEKSSMYRFFIHSTSIMSGSNGTFISLLVIAYLTNNMFAYQLFLEQGVDPNSPGAVQDSVQIPGIAVMCIPVEDVGPPFLELAIQYGGHYTANSKAVYLDKRNSTRGVENYLKSSHSEKPGLKALKNLHDSTIIEACCNMDNYKALSLFMPQMSFEDQLEVLSRLTSNSFVYKRFIVPSTQHECDVVTDFKNLNKVQEKFLDNEFTVRLFSFLIYSKGHDECLKLIEQLIDPVKSKIHALAKDAPAELLKLQTDALAETRHITVENKMAYKLDRSLFLFMMDPNPNFMKYQSLMQLFCRNASLMSKRSLFGADKNMYALAKHIAEKSIFASELQKTPLYKFVNEKLDGLAESSPAPQRPINV